MICCCSMAGTKACKNCNNEHYNFLGTNNYTLFDTNKSYTINAIDIISKPIVQYWCPHCDALLNKFDKYCHNCGKEIDWSDFEKE